jgi:hypothetical protein
VPTTRIDEGLETSISVSDEATGTGRIGDATAGRPANGMAICRESASNRSPRSRSSYVAPCRSASVSSSFGAPERTSTAVTRPGPATNSVRPSDFTESGSSTPSSWTFVPEKSGSGAPRAPPALPGATGRAPAAIAVSGR